MTDTMLERMARAIDPEAFESTADEPRIVQVRAGTRQREAVAKARAALEAIMDPSPGMAAAADAAGCMRDDQYAVMIDAILNGGA